MSLWKKPWTKKSDHQNFDHTPIFCPAEEILTQDQNFDQGMKKAASPDLGGAVLCCWRAGTLAELLEGWHPGGDLEQLPRV